MIYIMLRFRRDNFIIDDNIKKIYDLSYKFKKAKNENEKENIENELKDILFDLKKEAINKFKDVSDIKKFLDNIINFNNYSFNNQVLIWIQNPNASYVTSLKTISDMGYLLNRGSKGIKIFIPNFYNIAKIKIDDNNFEFKPYFLLNEDEKKKYKDKKDDSITFHKQKLSGFSLGNVFDLNDTNIPMDVINNELNPIIYDKKAEDLIDCFIKTIYNDGFTVQFKELEGETKGYCDHHNHSIVIKKGMGSLMQMKTLIHEYAHALAHKHLENNKKDYREHKNKYETEAESIAYVVSRYLNLDTTNFSLNYLYAWSKEKDFKEIDDSLNTIVNFSKRIINNFEKFYNKEFGWWEDEYAGINI